MKNWKATVTALALAPMIVFTACGDGGGGGIGTSSGSNANASLPPPVNATVTSVPLVGNVVADCANTGVGVVDQIINTVNALAGGSLPTSLPTLTSLLATGTSTLQTLPVIGGLIPDGVGGLTTIGGLNALSLLPTNVPLVSTLGGLSVIGQLPTVCSSIVGALPPLALTNPSAIVGALGSPTAILGLIPIFNASNNPVGLLLATLPAGLDPSSVVPISLPGVGSLPDLTSLIPLDLSTLPAVGPTLGTLAHSNLSLLGSVTGLLNPLLGGLLAGLA